MATVSSALRRAFSTTLHALPTNHAERSQLWVKAVGESLLQLEQWQGARLLHKEWGKNKHSLRHGEFLTDVAIVEVAPISSVSLIAAGTHSPSHEYVRRLLVAVESEFEPNTPHWLDDLSKLVVVDAPVRIFIASRAGGGRRPDLEKAQLALFAEVASRAKCEEFWLGLMPHPRRWSPSTNLDALTVLRLVDGAWIAS